MIATRWVFARRAVVRTTIILLLVLQSGFLLGAVACASMPKRTTPLDVTGGRTVEILVRDESAGYSYARYLVEKDGSLSFGGGMNALNERYTWTGPLTTPEIDLLFDRIDAAGWFEADPPSSYEPPSRSHIIRLRGPGGRRSFTVIGDDPGVTAVLDILVPAARRRLEPFIDSMPRPGEQEG